MGSGGKVFIGSCSFGLLEMNALKGDTAREIGSE